MAKHASSAHSKQKVEWDLKRILSAIFVAAISGLLIVFFIASDAISSCSGSSGQNGRLLLAEYKGGRIYLGDRDLANTVDNMQEQYRSANSQELAREAVNRTGQARIFSSAARRLGTAVTEETLKALLLATFSDPAQFNSADRSYQKEVLSQIETDFLRKALQTDIMASSRTTRLGLRIDSEIQAMKTAIDVVSLDLFTLIKNKTPSNEELKTWFESQKGTRGEEVWRKATAFEAVTGEARTALIESWKKANAAALMMGAVKEMDDKLKIVDNAVMAGQSLEAAAAAAGLPVLRTDFFAFGETPKAGETMVPVNRDFFRTLSGVATGSTSTVVKIAEKDGIPQAMLLFRVRERRTIPDYDPALIADKTAFDKLPASEQEKIRELIRTQLKRIEEQGKYALFNDFFTYLWMAANFTINEENLKKL
ncbi:MAG TPA: SurA N-terminal domain-containing protein [Spirochaetota bacterium]|nr:SurA N-terminal domain-containing protein [Spirochaetota bacterium]